MAEETIYCKNPKCKKPEQKWNTILRHSKTKTCKLFYTDNDREFLQTKSKTFQKKEDNNGTVKSIRRNMIPRNGKKGIRKNIILRKGK